MKLIATVLAGSILCGLLGCASKPINPEAATGKAWRPLFDGKSTNGWAMVGPGEFRLQKGELVTDGGMGMLWFTRQQFADCQIRVVFKLTAADDNSGVFIRMPKPGDPWDAVNYGYEVQIHNGGDEWHHTGCLYSLTKAQNIVSPKVGEWATMIITLDGNRTIVEVDGRLVTDYTEGAPVREKHIWYEPIRGRRSEKGYIGLQNHGGDARVHFKEVSFRPLQRHERTAKAR